MLAKLSDWFDHRTGYRKIVEALLIEHIPGGAKWRYVWGSTLAFVFSIQLVTGLLLMTAYSAGDSTAWGSVFFIQYEMDFGWLIRGLHHFGSQTMVVLLGVHMLQVVIAGAHLPPREVNWWLGLGLLGCVMGLSLTGYLLPWDQKGYWATQVATNIAGNLPGLGPWLQKVIVGGPSYGHHTLTRFFTMHVAVLPPLVVVLIIAHLAVFRRHGVTAPANAEGEGWFWPDQAFRDMLACLVIFGAMIGLAVWGGDGHKMEPAAAAIGSNSNPAESASPGWWSRLAHAGRCGYGVNLDAPADPSSDYSARPEWYFLFLFQLLKYFEGEKEIIGTVIIPGAAGLILAVLPLLGHGRMRKFGHVFGVIVIGGLLASVGVLTWLASDADRKNADFQTRRKNADELGARAVQLASHGIPAAGAVNLLRRDPMNRGPELFGTYCAGCHAHTPDHKSGSLASDLAGYATEMWIRGLLNDPGDSHYFGNTSLEGMKAWAEKAKDLPADKLATRDADLDLIAAWLAGHPRGEPKDGDDSSPFAKGFATFKKRCTTCHDYEGDGGSDGPSLTGYGSREWVRLMIMAPDHDSRYGGRGNSMPAFRNLEGPGGEVTRLEVTERNPDTKLMHLSDLERELILRWLLGDDRVVFGGDSISASPQ